MLQVVISRGEIDVIEVPAPTLRPGTVLVRTSHSLISAGTESAALRGGRREPLLLSTIRNRALLRRVIAHAAGHGVRSTVELARSRASAPSPLGYSASGVVLETAPEVGRLRVGDRVACAGAGYANHAAVNVVPENLVTRLPGNVSFEEGAFATLGAIALQGIRRCAPALGERVVVLGLGLLGQLAAQMLRAAGAVVVGVDLRRDRVERARALGMADGFALEERDVVAGVHERTEGRGADAVIVTAASGDAGLLDRACAACRRKGRVVLVGDVPVRMARESLYRKELDFLISTSYGPGRYDPEYEEKGRDYPLAYVRWTEGRNLDEVVRLIGAGSLKVRSLIDGVHPVAEARAAYSSLWSPDRPIGVMLDFHLEGAGALPLARGYAPRARVAPGRREGVFGVGVIGYGGYFRSVLEPLLRKHSGFRLAAICARNGLVVREMVETHGFERGTTDYRELLDGPDIDVVYVTTRHDLHYRLAHATLAAGKSVFVEKPMTLTVAEGRALADRVAQGNALLTVGFNRRFSPHARRLKELLQPLKGPKTMLYRINAGPLPERHWLLDPGEGGGRLLGEGVHFFDFLAFLAGAEPVGVQSVSPALRGRDEAVVGIRFADGSVGAVVYAGSGSPSAGKERVEVFAGGATCVIDDFRLLEVHGIEAAAGTRTRVAEKGQKEQLENLYRALRGEEPLGATVDDGLRATWCAERAIESASERDDN